MKKNILSLLFILIFVGYSVKASAQDSLKTQPKNTIYASGTLGWWFVASASYERRLFSTDNKFYARFRTESDISNYLDSDYIRQLPNLDADTFGGDAPENI